MEWWAAFWALPWWLCIIMIATSVVMIASSDTEHYGWSLVLLAFNVLGLHMVGAINIAEASNNVWTLLLTTFGYLAVGMMWTFFKWHLYVRNVAEDILSWNRSLSADACIKSYKTAVSLSNQSNMSMLINWALFWPMSMLKSLFGELLFGVCRWLIYEVFGGLYRNITMRQQVKLQGMMAQQETSQSMKLDEERWKSKGLS